MRMRREWLYYYANELVMKIVALKFLDILQSDYCDYGVKYFICKQNDKSVRNFRTFTVTFVIPKDQRNVINSFSYFLVNSD